MSERGVKIMVQYLTWQNNEIMIDTFQHHNALEDTVDTWRGLEVM